MMTDGVNGGKNTLAWMAVMLTSQMERKEHRKVFF